MSSLAQQDQPTSHTENSIRTIIISNLGQKSAITLKQLNKLFSTIGECLSYRTPNKDVAHVVYKTREQCIQSLILNHTEIKPESSADLTPRSIVVELLIKEETGETTAEENCVEAEEEFGGFGDLGALLFDDPANCHGEPGKPFIYKWPETNSIVAPPMQPLKLRVPEPEEWDLMAHFVWESSIKMADLIVTGIIPVKNKNVLEVGSGAGLPSIVSIKCGASYVIATDYPEQTVIDELKINMTANTNTNTSTENNNKDGGDSSSSNSSNGSSSSNAQVMGHSWGTNDCGDISSLYPNNQIDIILAADCLWLKEQHTNLFSTMRSCMNTINSIAYFTYQHHNEHAPSFFSLIEAYNQDNNETDNMKFQVNATAGEYGWGGRELEEFDPEDEEIMGPIYLATVTRVQ